MTLSKKSYVSVAAVLAASRLLLATAAQAQSLSFLDHVDFGAGYSPQSVAVGDLNGDGVPDLAVANAVHDEVSVLLGNGDGSFQPRRNFATDIRPSSVAIGDFNRDGIPDLAVANEGPAPYYQDGSISILLGTGDGSFTAAATIPAGDTPTAIAIADFNGDGASDLVIVNNGYWVDGEIGYAFVKGQTAKVFLGNVDGTFQSAEVLFVREAPISVAVGDFNGDGVPDLAVLSNYAPPFARAGTVTVLLGQGDGSFQGAGYFDVGFVSYSVAAGDFNGDGVVDLVVTNVGQQNVSVLLGIGNGTFQAQHNFAAGRNPVAVALGDFNGDGALDLAVANSFPESEPNSVSVLLGNADGTFQPPQSFAVRRGPHSVAVGDFNGDGIPDLVAGNESSGTVSVLINNTTR